MSIELATAYVSLVPSARNLQRNIARELAPLENEAEALGDRSSRRFGNKFVLGMGAVASRGAVALAAGFTLAAGAGIKVAADFEQTQIAFEGILGSADEANAVLGDLRDFANKTPFQFTDLTKASQQLLGVGFAAEDLIPTMGTLGDLAAGVGAGPAAIESTVRALGQMKGRGKVASQELIQISEALPGFSAIGAIAEGMGVSTAEAFKAVENGAVPAGEGIDYILAGMEKFPGASGAMERQSKTLNGVISTFKDTLATTAIDFITPYLPAISAGVAAFGGFISQTLVPNIQNLINLFDEEGIGGIFSRLGTFIETQAPILGEKLMILGGEFVDWVAPQIPPFLTEVANLVGAVGLWAVSDGIPLLAGALLTMAGEFAKWVTDPKDGGIVQFIEALPGIITGLETWVREDAMPAFKEGGKKLGAALWDGFVEGLDDALEGPPGAEFHIPGTDIDIPYPDLGFPGRASGGRAMAGHPYIVGERRAELFVPDQNGYILPEVPSGFGAVGSPLIGSLSVVQMPGEDSGTTVIREVRRYQALAG